MSNAEQNSTTNEQLVDVSTSKRRFDVDAYLAAQGIRIYEMPILGKTYQVAPEVPLNVWLDMNERAEATGAFTSEDITRYFDLSFGEGVHEELLAAGLGRRTREAIFSALIAIHDGVEIGDAVEDETDKSEDDGEESGEA